jgi:hypothetical protein
MTVVLVKEIPERRTGWGDFKTGRTYQTVYRVTTNDNADGPKTVTAALPIGFTNTYVSGNDSDPLAYCRKIEATLVGDDMRLWEVIVTYATALDWPAQTGTIGGTPTTPGSQDSNPINRPAVFSFSTIKNKYNDGKDLSSPDRKPFVNTAGQAIKTLAYDRSLLQIQISKNYSVSRATGTVLGFVDTLNSNTWQGYGVEKVKCDDIKLVSQYENGLSFYRGDITLHYNPQGWHPFKVLNEGSYQLKSGFIRCVEDRAGRPIGIAPLGSNGRQLEPGEDPYYLEFRMWNSVSWTGFP